MLQEVILIRVGEKGLLFLYKILSVTGIPESKMFREETETIFDEILSEKFPNSTKMINPQLQDPNQYQAQDT